MRAAAAVAAETTVQTACTAASLSRSQHCHRAFDPCGNQVVQVVERLPMTSVSAVSCPGSSPGGTRLRSFLSKLS